MTIAYYEGLVMPFSRLYPDIEINPKKTSDAMHG